MRLAVVALVLLAGYAPLAGSPADDPGERFRTAGDLLKSGDAPKAIAAYRALAAEGHESASLCWNWAQAASARGDRGEALWALLRAREVDPGDAAVLREIETTRRALSLDPAELAPDPLAPLSRVARRFHLGLLALALAGLSLVLHALWRAAPTSRWPGTAAWVCLTCALVAAAVPLAGAASRPAAVVVGRAPRLLDAASPAGRVLTTLREGEVVPVLEDGGGYLRVEDSSGARGWASAADVRRLDRPPQP